MGNSDHGTTYTYTFPPPRFLARRWAFLWVVRVEGDDGELRPWHYIHVYSIERRLIMRVRYDSHTANQAACASLSLALALSLSLSPPPSLPPSPRTPSAGLSLARKRAGALRDPTVVICLRLYEGYLAHTKQPPPLRTTIGPSLPSCRWWVWGFYTKSFSI